jgi:hypothetical protein
VGNWFGHQNQRTGLKQVRVAEEVKEFLRHEAVWRVFSCPTVPPGSSFILDHFIDFAVSGQLHHGSKYHQLARKGRLHLHHSAAQRTSAYESSCRNCLCMCPQICNEAHVLETNIGRIARIYLWPFRLRACGSGRKSNLQMLAIRVRATKVHLCLSAIIRAVASQVP